MPERTSDAKNSVLHTGPELVSQVRVGAIDIRGRRVEAIIVHWAGLTLRADTLSYRHVIAASRLARSHGAAFELEDSIAQRLMIVPDEVQERPGNGPILATSVQLRKSVAASQPGDVARVLVNGLVLVQHIRDAVDVVFARRIARSHEAAWVAPAEIAQRYLRELCDELR